MACNACFDDHRQLRCERCDRRVCDDCGAMGEVVALCSICFEIERDEYMAAREREHEESSTVFVESCDD